MVEMAKDMRGMYYVKKWGDDAIPVLADTVAKGGNTLILKRDGKIVASFESYDAWWFKARSKSSLVGGVTVA